MMRGLKEHEGYWHFRPKNKEPQQEATRGRWKQKKKTPTGRRRQAYANPQEVKQNGLFLLFPPPSTLAPTPLTDQQTCNPSERMPQKAHEKKAKHRRDRKREYNNSPWVVSPNLFLHSSSVFSCLEERDTILFSSNQIPNLGWSGQVSHAFLTGKLVASTASCQTIATLKRASSFASFNSFNSFTYIHTYIHTYNIVANILC
jgi:hypothetical protein